MAVIELEHADHLAWLPCRPLRFDHVAASLVHLRDVR
jgi:hypothetical protein